MTQAPLTVRRWRRTEYEHLASLGAFRGENIELIGGQLVVAEPQYPYHASAISTAEYALRAILPAGWIVRTQLPLSIDEESEPEPDLIVVAGRPSDYRHEHPTRPLLAIEIADTSLHFDREQKGSLYAKAAIADYWIVNLVDRVVEIYRDPRPDPSAPFGWRYASIEIFGPEGMVAPLAFPSSPLAAGTLLP